MEREENRCSSHNCMTDAYTLHYTCVDQTLANIIYNDVQFVGKHTHTHTHTQTCAYTHVHIGYCFFDFKRLLDIFKTHLDEFIVSYHKLMIDRLSTIRS